MRSQQLGVLRHEDLVMTRRSGRSIHYRVASPAVHAHPVHALPAVLCPRCRIPELIIRGLS
jgi:hypothetical protein